MADLKLLLVVLLACFVSAMSQRGEDYPPLYNHKTPNSPENQASYQKPLYKDQSYSYKPNNKDKNYNPISYQNDHHTQSYAHEPESNLKVQSYSYQNPNYKNDNSYNTYKDRSYDPSRYKADYPTHNRTPHNPKSKYTQEAVYREHSYPHKNNYENPNYKTSYLPDRHTLNNANHNEQKNVYQPREQYNASKSNYIPTSFKDGYPTDYHTPHRYTYGPNDNVVKPLSHAGSSHNPLCNKKCCNAGVATIRILFQEPCKKNCKCIKYPCRKCKKCHKKKCNSSNSSSSR